MILKSPIQLAIKLALLVISLLIVTQPYAQSALPIVVETEPNNEPQQALTFTAPAVLSGNLPSGDQDAFVWKISDVDAQKQWDFTLHGMPGALTGVSIMRVNYGPDPNTNDNSAEVVIIGYEKLLSFGIRDGSRPVIRENLFFPAGEYVVGFFGAGQSSGFRLPTAEKLDNAITEVKNNNKALEEDSTPFAYKLSIVSNSAPTISTKVKNTTQDTANKLRIAKTFTSLSHGETWYMFELDKAQENSRWTISGEVMIEHFSKIEILNNNSETIANTKTDKYGHYVLPNLVLPAGKYYVKINDSAEISAPRSIRIIATGIVTDSSEQEPNDSWPLANMLSFNDIYNAHVDKISEKDYFRFEISEEQENEVFDLVVDAPEIKKIKFCILTDKGVSRSCRTGKPPLRLDSLNFNSGYHGLKISRGAAEGAYTITKITTGSVSIGTEIEPNNIASDASVFGPKNIIKGTLPSGDEDYFTLNVTSEPQLWRLQAIGTGLGDLTYYSGHGGSSQRVRAGANSKRLRLDNLFLLPGTHQFRLNAAKGTKYVLRALPLGPPGPHAEWESNNSRARAQDLKFDNKVLGLITEPSDIDYFRFHIPGQQFVRLSLNPPPQSKYSLELFWDGGFLKEYRSLSSDSPLDEILHLESGDYYLYLRSSLTSDVEYELRVSRTVDPMSADIEPNDDTPNASEVPATGIIEGSVGKSHAQKDLYRLGTSVLPRQLVLTGEMDDSLYLYLVDGAQKNISVLKKVEESRWEAVVPADTESFLQIYYGRGEYKFQIDLEGMPSPLPAVTKLPIKITFPPGDRTVSAYREEYQHLDLEYQIENSTEEPLKLTLEATTDNDKWIPSVNANVEIPANQTHTSTIRVDVKTDIWPDQPVLLKLTASDEMNRVTTVNAELFAERFKELVNGRHDIPLPDPLHGTFNVASLAFGGEMLTDEGYGLTSLHNGVTPLGEYFWTKRTRALGPGKVRPAIDLAGEDPVEVVGFTFHPFGLQDHQPAQCNATKVLVELSLDGKEFEFAIEVDLFAQTIEQGFSLTKPIVAKYARLTLLNSLDKSCLALGEWKVLASESAASNLTNIALPELGGHVVWTLPTFPKYSYVKTMLTHKADATKFRTRTGLKYEWVIGFHNNRAAYINELTWRDKVDVKDKRFYEVDVFTSLETPAGPWVKKGTLKLNEGEINTFKLPQVTWARFVRFEARTHQPHRGSVYFPDQIEVIESREHGSVIGEWGQNSSKGPYESLISPALVRLADVPKHLTKEKALPLESNVSIQSRVRLGDYDNWYSVTVPLEQNTLIVKLDGYPRISAVAELIDNSGVKQNWFSVDKTINNTLYKATVEPGIYFIKVKEPPRSVIFTWDTSGSTAGVRPIIRQAIMEYVEEVKPGLDEAHMLPFGGSFLSQRWLDQPYLLKSVLNHYNGAGNSSNAESALVKASEKLRDRQGQKIIVIITDAATPTDTALWQTLHDVRPRIIALGVNSKGAFSSTPNREQDLLQDWATSSGGYYEYVENIGAVARAFDRASSRIRHPAEYRITSETLFQEAPIPGYLKIEFTENASVEQKLSKPAIEVILDASGSMLQKLGGKRRYQIASEVLADLIVNKLPNNVDFGLRVFGHKEVGSCRTDLEIPIGPLNRKKALSTLKSITPKNLAKTPIAASIAAIKKDMKSIGGNKTVLVITDGEETCEGDVINAITDLQESGVDAIINVVGFAIDDTSLETKFRQWATLGGGEYRSASDQNLLNKSIQNLTSLRFSIMDSNGNLLGPYYSAQDAIELEPGEYVVHFRKDEKYKANIQPEQTTLLHVGY